MRKELKGQNMASPITTAAMNRSVRLKTYFPSAMVPNKNADHVTAASTEQNVSVKNIGAVMLPDLINSNIMEANASIMKMTPHPVLEDTSTPPCLNRPHISTSTNEDGNRMNRRIMLVSIIGWLLVGVACCVNRAWLSSENFGFLHGASGTLVVIPFMAFALTYRSMSFEHFFSG